MSEWKTNSAKISSKTAAVQSIPRDVTQAAKDLANLRLLKFELVEELKELMESYGHVFTITRAERLIDLIAKAEEQD